MKVSWHVTARRNDAYLWTHRNGKARLQPGTPDIGGRTIDWQSLTHYDGESRIFARSAGDDNAAIAATLSALMH
jgi:hypothetical protein